MKKFTLEDMQYFATAVLDDCDGDVKGALDALCDADYLDEYFKDAYDYVQDLESSEGIAQEQEYTRLVEGAYDILEHLLKA